MSLHTSLVGGTKSAKHRNVLRKIERIEKLKAATRYSEGQIFDLPKVRSIKAAVKKKAKKKAAEGEAGTAPAAAEAKPKAK